MERRAVITGIGIVSPAGIGIGENWKNLLEGTSGIATLTSLPPEHLPVSIGGEVKNFIPKNFIKDRKTIRLTFHNVHLALAAAQLAMQHSGIDHEQLDPTRFGAIVGSGGGGFDDGPGVEDLSEPILKSWDAEKGRFDSALFGEKGIPIAYPLFLLKALPNNAFYYISLMYNIQGENDNIVSSFSGGSQAVGDAFRAIRRGLADVFVAGGYDSLLTPNTLYSLHSFNLLSMCPEPAQACRPFDRERSGMVAGEGAGFLIIEELEHARRRGATIYAEIAGYGNTSSAYHLFDADPEGRGLQRAAQRALQDAGLQPDAIDWISADGTGGRVSDSAEARALHATLGPRAAQIPLSATKGVTAHMGSAAGAVEAAFCSMALTAGLLPPTAGYRQGDDDCALNVIAGAALERPITTALSLNQGIGGQCIALVLKKFTG